MYSFLPDGYIDFVSVLDAIYEFVPAGVSLVGSYGDANKIPNNASDIDIVFVFNATNICEINKDIRARIETVPNLRIIELGVHYQFGFVYSVYFEENPMKWMDVGIMDSNFARNYLVDFPKIDVKGAFRPCKNKEVPNNHLNHLSRKIVKHLNKGQFLQATIAAYRYLNWLNVENTVKKIKGAMVDSKFEAIYANKIKLNDIEVLNYVLGKIKDREIGVWREINEMATENINQRISV